MIRIRPHHLLCIPRFYRGGYAAEGFKKVSKILRKNSNIKIRIVKECDDVCNKCNNYDNVCKKRQGINKEILIQDGLVLKKLNLKDKSIHKVKDVFNLSINTITKKNLKSICEGCEFLSGCLKWGVNKSFLKDINNNGIQFRIKKSSKRNKQAKS